MFKQRFAKQYFTLFALCLFSLAAVGDESLQLSSTDRSSIGRSSTLVIGKVSSNPAKHYKRLKPIAEYVASRLSDVGITTAKVLMAENDAQMLHYLKSGQVDWVSETAISTAIYQQHAGAEPLLVRWKKGVPSYKSLIVVRKDSGIQNLRELSGKTIAFEDAGSTTAFYVPAYALLQQGMLFQQLDSIRQQPAQDRVGYVFSKQEINSSTWLHNGLVDAMAISDQDWWKASHVPPAFRESFQVIHESRSLPRVVESVRAGLDSQVKSRLKALLLAAKEDPAAADALRAYQKTRRFSEISKDELASLRQAARIFEEVHKGL